MDFEGCSGRNLAWKVDVEEITLGRVGERQKQAQVGGGGGEKAVMVQQQSWVGHGTSCPAPRLSS